LADFIVSSEKAIAMKRDSILQIRNESISQQVQANLKAAMELIESVFRQVSTKR